MIVLSFNNPYKSNDDEKISQIIIMSLKHIVTGTYVMHKKKHLVGDVSQLNLLIDICTSLD